MSVVVLLDSFSLQFATGAIPFNHTLPSTEMVKAAVLASTVTFNPDSTPALAALNALKRMNKAGTIAGVGPDLKAV